MGLESYANKKVLVTGGTGLIGRPLVELLLEAGAGVRVASLDDPSRCPKGAKFFRGNLMQWDFCRRVVGGMDYVFHVAGIKGSVGIGVSKAASFFVPHLLMNTHMMEAARQAGVERYLFTSSVAVYPSAQVFREDEAWSGPPHPTDQYAAWAKRMGELQAETYKLEYGWDKIAIVRPTNTYGPWDNFDKETAMVVPALISRVLNRENPLYVWGDGSAIRDFVYSEDVAEGMMLALEKAANCTPINLGSGNGVSIRELVATIISFVHPAPNIVWETGKQLEEKVRVMDITRAREIGFEPKTSLREGIKETMRWYLANRELAGERYSVFREEVKLL